MEFLLLFYTQSQYVISDLKQDSSDIKRKRKNAKHPPEPGAIQSTLYVIISLNPCDNPTSRYSKFPHFTHDIKDCTQVHAAIEPGFEHR